MRLPGAPDGAPNRSTDTGGASRWPDPDEHLVEPDTWREVIDGEIVELAPSRPGHGDAHCRLDAAIGLSVADGYIASSDLLTRRDAANDFATDTCVRKVGIDPDTGCRYLEELSFEVFLTQSRPQACQRARAVLGSGVRRVFGLFVEPGSPDDEAAGRVAITVEEWSPGDDDWVALSRTDYIEDPSLATRLPVASLVDATAIDDAVAQMLIAKRNPVIEELEKASRAEGFQRGRDEGFRDGQIRGRCDARRQALLDVLAHRGLTPTSSQRSLIQSCTDEERLDRWFARALSAIRASDLFGES